MSQQIAYLEAELLTATPQKLRYLLLCGALRFARQAIAQWERQENEAAFESLVRCRKIIAELMSSVRPDANEAARVTLALHAFLFRTLTEAQLHRDAARVGEVIRVLEEEWETWRQVCEKFPDAPTPEDAAAAAPREVTASDAPASGNAPKETGFDTARLNDSSTTAQSPPGGFKWDA